MDQLLIAANHLSEELRYDRVVFVQFSVLTLCFKLINGQFVTLLFQEPIIDSILEPIIREVDGGERGVVFEHFKHVLPQICFCHLRPAEVEFLQELCLGDVLDHACKRFLSLVSMYECQTAQVR